MFCPLCKAEYRQGYTRCKDCDVELVWQLNSRSAAPPAEYESAVLLWSGGDPATFAALIGRLREAHIPLIDSLSHNPGVATSSPFPSPFDAAESFEVRVRPFDLKRATHLLEALQNQEPENACDADLVEASPGEFPLSESGANPKDASYLLLWRGEHPLTYAAIRDALEEAHIHWRENPPRSHAAPLMLGLPTDFEARFGFEILVPANELDKAQPYLEKILVQEAEEPSVQAEEEDPDAGVESLEPEFPQKWNPEDATVELWSSEDAEKVQFFVDTFRENGGASRTLQGDSGRIYVFVHPSDESRAHEILREIISGTPPL
jgi:hypothetical protein